MVSIPELKQWNVGVRRLARWGLPALLTALGGAGLLALLIAQLRVDESVFLLIGREMRTGRLPYRDLWDHKGPLIYGVAWVASFFGPLAAPVGRLIVLVPPLFGALALARVLGLLSRRFTLTLAALGLAVHGAVVEGMMTEPLEAGAVLWATALAMRAQQAEAPRWWLLGAGVALGLGVVARLPALLYLVAFVVALTAWGWQVRPTQQAAGAWLLLGAALPIGLIGVVFAAAGLLPAMNEALIQGNLVYGRQTAPSLGVAARTVLGQVVPLLSVTGFLWVLGVPGLATLPSTRGVRRAVLGLLGLALFAALSTRAGLYYHYWTTAFWLLVFGSAWALQPFLTGKSAWQGQSWTLAFLGTLFLISTSRYAVAALVEGQEAGSNEARVVAANLQPHVPPGSSLWVTGSLTGGAIYLYSDTHPGTRYPYTNAAAALVLDPAAVITDLTANRPAVLVGPIWTDGEGFHPWVPAPLRAYLTDHYRIIGPIPAHTEGYPYLLLAPRER